MNIAYPVKDYKQYKITQLFGENQYYYSKWGMIGHNGIDIGCHWYTHIQACDSGKIIKKGNDPSGYGFYVRVQHDWGESIYAHFDSFECVLGDYVARGELLGLSGSSGNSTGPHLHFGIRVNPVNYNNGYSGYVDPMPYLKEPEPPIIEETFDMSDQAGNILKRAELKAKLVTKDGGYFLRVDTLDYWIPGPATMVALGYGSDEGSIAWDKAMKVTKLNPTY